MYMKKRTLKVKAAACILATTMMIPGLMGCAGKETKDESVEQNTQVEEAQNSESVQEEVLAMAEASITPEDESTSETKLEPVESKELYTTLYVVNCKESITLRTSASTKASEICQIPLGAAVSFVETASNGFYKIIYNGKTGYSLASYLDTQYHDTNQASNTSSRESANTIKTTVPAQVYTTMYVVNCKESITLRTSASTKASEICQIPLGAAVSYVEYAGNDFYLIVYNGQVGYSLASYLESAYGQLQSYVDDYLVVVNCKESITLRTAPSTKASEICQIPLGYTVEFVALAEDGFYQVSYNGQVGYALASYLY